jgi:hypothetical protein
MEQIYRWLPYTAILPHALVKLNLNLGLAQKKAAVSNILAISETTHQVISTESVGGV